MSAHSPSRTDEILHWSKMRVCADPTPVDELQIAHRADALRAGLSKPGRFQLTLSQASTLLRCLRAIGESVADERT